MNQKEYEYLVELYRDLDRVVEELQRSYGRMQTIPEQTLNRIETITKKLRKKCIQGLRRQ